MLSRSPAAQLVGKNAKPLYPDISVRREKSSVCVFVRMVEKRENVTIPA